MTPPSLPGREEIAEIISRFPYTGWQLEAADALLARLRLALEADVETVAGLAAIIMAECAEYGPVMTTTLATDIATKILPVVASECERYRVELVRAKNAQMDAEMTALTLRADLAACVAALTEAIEFAMVSGTVIAAGMHNEGPRQAIHDSTDALLAKWRALVARVQKEGRG